jgi:dUTP pyrophosphatase
VIVINHDPREPIRLARGDRLAQLVIQRVERARFVEVDELPESVRAAGGFGSTGGWVDHGSRKLPAEVSSSSAAKEGN